MTDGMEKGEEILKNKDVTKRTILENTDQFGSCRCTWLPTSHTLLPLLLLLLFNPISFFPATHRDQTQKTVTVLREAADVS